MKNTKSLFKIMAALMSLALVLGALFALGAVSAGATEEQEREIIPVPDLPTFYRPYKTVEEIGIDLETIDAYFPQEIEVRYEDGKVYVEDIGAAYVSAGGDYDLELVDGYWTAELEAEPVFIYVYSYEGTYMYDKHLSAAYGVDGIRDPYININDYINSVFITFSLEDENVTIQYKSGNYYYEDKYEDGVLDTHGVSNIQDPETVNDVFYDADGKIRFCRLLTDDYYYYFPGQGWSHSWLSFSACDAPAGYEDKDETYFAANKPALICSEAEGDDIVHDMADATCLSPATCKNCEQTVGEALGHDIVIDEAIEPTCTETGLTEGSYCSRCDEMTMPQEVIEALGHDMADATCTSPKTCKTCGETEGEALGHDWIDATYDAPKTCSVCGETEGDPLEPDPTPEGPSQMIVMDVTDTTIMLIWTASPSENVVKYVIFDWNTREDLGETTGTEFTLTGLTPSTSYGIAVCAVNASGTRSVAQVIFQITMLATPETESETESETETVESETSEVATNETESLETSEKDTETAENDTETSENDVETSENDVETSKNDAETEEKTEETTSTPSGDSSGTENDKNSKTSSGCGSSIGIGVVAMVTILGAAVVFKKKEK